MKRSIRDRAGATKVGLTPDLQGWCKRRLWTCRSGFSPTACTLGGMLAFSLANADPQEGQVRAGSATVATNGNITTITQTSERTVIDWRSFDIAAGETVRFDQPGARAAALNRVTGSQVSTLFGTLTANGQVYLVNPNGLLIGNGASVSAASFIASTASIGTAGFMANPAEANGRYVFNELTAAANGGTIVNSGTITATDGGLVALVAPAVKNTGTINARLGTIELASANQFTLDLFGDDLVRIAVDDSIGRALTDVAGDAVDAQLQSSGELRADGGKVVLLTVPAAAGVVGRAINLSGIARAQTIAPGSEGSIRLLAAGGSITVSGTLDATAPVDGQSGGDITVIGSAINLPGTARVDASGRGGGGLVVVGGRFTAGGTTTETATAVLENGAVLAACGSANCSSNGSGGAGGEARLYSTNGTRLAGEMNVSSGAESRAGVIEIISNAGPTELAATARVIGVTGANQEAGFAAVIGNTLSVHPDALRDMRDTLGNTPFSIERAIYDPTQPALRQYILPPDNDGDGQPDLNRQTTRAPLLFHAYSDPNYAGALVFDGFPLGNVFAPRFGVETPVGTLRPNAGAPSTFAATAADPLAAIPISFFTAPPPRGTSTADLQISNILAGFTRELLSRLSSGTPIEVSEDGAGQLTPLISGGPGVARIADLGLNGALAGAAPDVFNVNLHVLAPAAEASALPVKEYLCQTPYSGNACEQETTQSE